MACRDIIIIVFVKLVEDRLFFGGSTLTSNSLPPALSLSVVGLERALMQYCSQPNDQPFDIKTVPIETTQDKPKCKQQHILH